MDLEGARLQLLLGLAFGQRMVEGQDEWRDVPEAVRTSFLLVAKELRRLRRLLAANLLQPSSVHPSSNPRSTIEEGPQIQQLKTKVQQLKSQLEEAQALADQRYVKGKQRLSRLWGELATTAKVSADAQTQHAAEMEKLSVTWAGVEGQLQLLQTQVAEQEQALQDASEKSINQQVEDALGDLVDNQKKCRKEVRRLQRALVAHDFRGHREHKEPEDEGDIAGARRKDTRVDVVEREGRKVAAVNLSLRERFAGVRRKQMMKLGSVAEDGGT